MTLFVFIVMWNTVEYTTQLMGPNNSCCCYIFYVCQYISNSSARYILAKKSVYKECRHSFG